MLERSTDFRRPMVRRGGDALFAGGMSCNERFKRAGGTEELPCSAIEAAQVVWTGPAESRDAPALACMLQECSSPEGSCVSPWKVFEPICGVAPASPWSRAAHGARPRATFRRTIAAGFPPVWTAKSKAARRRPILKVLLLRSRVDKIDRTADTVTLCRYVVPGHPGHRAY